MVKLLIRRPKDFDFQPGEYVYLNVPSLARYEWHPFTISSAPEFEGECLDCAVALLLCIKLIPCTSMAHTPFLHIFVNLLTSCIFGA